MLDRLTLQNVGPAPAMDLQFGDRLNLLTGDNGLGKSFLLDIAWWALTGNWPAEVNKKLFSGGMAKPNSVERSAIAYSFSSGQVSVTSGDYFERKHQNWDDQQIHDSLGPQQPGQTPCPGDRPTLHAEGGCVKLVDQQSL